MEIRLSDIAGGELQAKANQALQEIITNMLDPNTPWKQNRSLTLKIIFSQNEERDDLNITIGVEKKLASVKPIATKAYIGKDLDTGQVYLEEYGAAIRGQMSLDDVEQEQKHIITDEQGRHINTDTGEVLSAGGVIDMRQRKAQ